MAPPDEPGPAGRLLGGRYRLEQVVGTGTSARVHRATDTQLDRTVAVKVLHEALASDETFLRRFRVEARSAAALDDPHVVTVLDWGEDGRPTPTGTVVEPYLVTEWLGGGSLRSMLDAGHRLSVSQALVVGLDAARALDHAHRRGLVHRDVKPANLLFDSDGGLRLADFGLARALAEASWTEPLGATVGTARYASPEQVSGGLVGGRADVYSLALVLVEAVTGEVPFLGGSTAETLARRTQQDLELGGEFGPLRAVLERAGRRNPEERPDAEELTIALMAAAEDLPRPEPLPLAPPPAAVPGAAAPGGAAPADDVPGPAGPDALDRPGTAVAGAPAAPGARDAGAPDAGGRTTGRGRALLAVAVGVLLVGGLAGWWFGIRTPTHEVPRFVGDTAEEATAVAEALRWTVDDDTLVREDGTEAGEVVAQSPRPGTQLAEGRTVRLTVSLGPTLVVYPTGLAGRPVSESEAAVAAADLRVGEVTTAFDEEVAKGLVVTATPSVAPDRSGEVPRGTPVDLVVSDGPAPRTVPDGLVGLPRAVAGARLDAEGLRAAVEEVFDESAPRGVVLRLGTPSGTEVPRGTTVTLVVSKGRAPVPVPDVTGRTGTDAVTVLEGAGFPVAGIEGPPGGVVLATDPPAGEARPPGTPVRVFTRQ